MKTKIEYKWHCRRNGGLFLGFRCDFPLAFWEGKSQDGEVSWKRFGMSLGFLVFSVRITVDYDFEEEKY